MYKEDINTFDSHVLTLKGRTVGQQVSVGLRVLSKLGFLATFPKILKPFQIAGYVRDAGTRLRHLTHSPSSVECNRVT